MEEFPVIDAADWELAGEETQGRTRHPWLRHADRERTWLYKETVVIPGHELHEDLTEKIASEIAMRLGLPCARVDLAERHGRRGCLIEDLRWSKGDLLPGKVLLSGTVEGYDPDSRERLGHNLANIEEALSTYGPPPSVSPSLGQTAVDVFTGFLVLDALIANTDRHDGNWAILVRPPGDAGMDALCGTYDHASSLGFNLTNTVRRKRLEQGLVASWAQKAKARQFEHVAGQPRQTLVDLALHALGRRTPDIRSHWLRAVALLDRAAFQEVLHAAPGLSDDTATFTEELLATNRDRLLRSIGGHLQ